MIYLKPSYSILQIDMYPGCCDEDCDEQHDQEDDVASGFWLTCYLHGEIEWFDVESDIPWEELEESADEHMLSFLYS